MPTVRSLEERLDEFATDGDQRFAELTTKMDALATHQRDFANAQVKLQAKLDDVASNHARTQAQLASIDAAFGAQQAQTAITNVRLDGVIECLKSTQFKLDATTARLGSAETGLATIEVKIGSIGTKLDEVAEKFSSHRDDFVDFRGQVNATLGIARWIAATAVVTMISVIFAAFTVVRSAGNLETTVQQQGKTLDEIQRELKDMRPKK